MKIVLEISPGGRPGASTPPPGVPVQNTFMAPLPFSCRVYFCGETAMEFGFDHVHFLVSDVRALTGYFECVFGMEAVEYIDDHKGAAYAIFRLGGGTLQIRGMREGDAPDARAPRFVEGLDHVGFAVEDVDAAVAWLASRGAEVLDAPQRTGIGGRAIAFIRGPGNVRIELCERVRIGGGPS